MKSLKRAFWHWYTNRLIRQAVRVFGRIDEGMKRAGFTRTERRQTYRAIINGRFDVKDMFSGDGR